MPIRGVVNIEDAEDDEETPGRRSTPKSSPASMRPLDDLPQSRRREGGAIGACSRPGSTRSPRLTRRAEASPARQPEAIRVRLAEQIATLLDAAPALDPDRLHQEAVLLATKADIREEIDRLDAHVAAARDLLAAGGAVGRRLDFLAQEFNREVNTLCSKSNDRASHRDRARDEGGGRPAPRADPEPGVAAMTTESRAAAA